MEPTARPSFLEIVQRLEAMLLMAGDPGLALMDNNGTGLPANSAPALNGEHLLRQEFRCREGGGEEVGKLPPLEEGSRGWVLFYLQL